MRKLHLLLPLALLPLVLGLAACGGGGESAEDKIVDVIETSVTSTDPATCTALLTQSFMEQTQFEQGKAAVEGCEADAEEAEDDPDSVKVSQVEVDGSAATADVAFSGGSFDGQTLEVALVEEGGDWKLDAIVGFAKFDQEKLLAALEKSLKSGDNALEPEIASCFTELLGLQPRQRIEDTLIGGSPDGIVEITEICNEQHS